MKAFIFILLSFFCIEVDAQFGHYGPVMAGSNNPSTLHTGLTAWYSMEDASGAVQDATANNFDLAVGNLPLYQATGKVGYGINFSVANSIIYRSAADLNPTGNDFTISCYFNLNTLPSVSGDDAYIARFQYNTAPYYSIDIYIDTENDLIFSLQNVGSTPVMAYVGIASSGTWYHAVFRMKGIGYDPEIWINGTSVGTALYDALASNLLVANGNFNMGNAYTGDISHADAIIDLFGIWDRDLTDAEITELDNNDYPF